MSAYRRLLDVIEAVQRWLVFVAYVVVIVVVSFQVINRYWLHIPVVWTADLATVAFIWLALLTASTSVRGNGHFRMQAVLDAVGGGSVRLVLELFALAVILLLSYVLIVEGWRLAERGLREVSPGLGVRMVWAYAVVPLTSMTALLFALERVWIEIRAEPGAARLGFQEDSLRPPKDEDVA